MERPCILKLGGSVVTRKLGAARFDRDAATAVAKAVAIANVPLVLVHGTGSYGKPPARRFGYLDGRIRADCARIVPQVQERLARLRAKVLRALLAEGVAAVAVSTFGTVWLRRGAISRLDSAQIEAIVARGLVPVLSGELVVDEEGGFSVCSSDALAAALATQLRARRLVVATDVPGVMNADGGLVDEIGCAEALDGLPMTEHRGDVSGGMAAKVRSAMLAARHGIETIVVDGRDPDLVADALRGRPVRGTRFAALHDRRSAARCAE